MVLGDTSADATNAFRITLKLIDVGLSYKLKGAVGVGSRSCAVTAEKKDQFTSSIENADYVVDTTAAMRCFYDVMSWRLRMSVSWCCCIRGLGVEEGVYILWSVSRVYYGMM